MNTLQFWVGVLLVLALVSMVFFGSMVNENEPNPADSAHNWAMIICVYIANVLGCVWIILELIRNWPWQICTVLMELFT